MGNIGPRQQRYEVLPDLLDLSRLEDETRRAEAPPADAVDRDAAAIDATDPVGRGRRR